MGTLTLTSLIPTIYEAMDMVSRERVGLISAVSQDFSAEQAAVGQVIMSPVVGAMASENLTAAAYAADTPNQTIGNVQMTISKAKSVPFGITGEETKGLQSAGTLGNINRDRIAQAFRTLSNEIETDLYEEVYKRGMFSGADLLRFTSRQAVLTVPLQPPLSALPTTLATLRVLVKFWMKTALLIWTCI